MIEIHLVVEGRPTYEISGRDLSDPREIIPDSRAWLEWLDGVSSSFST
ncbi:MAG: hypothetical protein ACJ788_16480 [Ktedonobacteraceae bacterium]